MRCPHCNQTPIWDRYERCSNSGCTACQPGATWLRRSLNEQPESDDEVSDRSSANFVVIYVCRLCNEAVS